MDRYACRQSIAHLLSLLTAVHHPIVVDRTTRGTRNLIYYWLSFLFWFNSPPLIYNPLVYLTNFFDFVSKLTYNPLPLSFLLECV